MLKNLFAGTCFLCRGSAEGTLCAACEADLPALGGPCCPRCALPSPRGEPCGRCLARPPAFDRTVASLAYAFPADVLVHALKFRGELALAPLLGGILRRAIAAADAPQVTCVAPVPLSVARLRERGFNQALEIARACSAGAPLHPALLERVRDTRAQFDLPWSERQRNVRAAFHVRQEVAGMSVAIVDDVMTTGATLEEIARALKAAGAARVVNWVVARTPAPN
jgi:ComF family protein